jgi:hypothetical protein
MIDLDRELGALDRIPAPDVRDAVSDHVPVRTGDEQSPFVRGRTPRVAVIATVTVICLVAGGLVWRAFTPREDVPATVADGGPGSGSSPIAPSPTAGPGVVPTTASGAVIPEGIAGFVTCWRSATGGANVLQSESDDPIAACERSLTREHILTSGDWVMCAAPGSVWVAQAKDAAVCEGQFPLHELPEGYEAAVDRVNEARRLLSKRFATGECFDHEIVVEETERILREVGLDRWAVRDTWKASEGACAAPSYWNFEDFQVHVMNES